MKSTSDSKPLQSFGVSEQAAVSNELERCLEELSILGFAVLENVLSVPELKTARERIDAVYARQAEEFTAEEMSGINEAFMARLPLSYDEYFATLLKREVVLDVMRAILGKYFILHLQNAIINMPKQAHHQNSWHRDIPYHDFTISRPLAIGALYCIDDFTEETGGTIVLPFSHQIERMPSDTFIQNHAFQVTAKAGSVLLFDSMLFHRAGYNSSERIRRGVNHMFTSAILKQQINIPEALEGRFGDDPSLRTLLGYDVVPAKSVREWRAGRLKRTKE